jgi:hypothetical protein
VRWKNSLIFFTIFYKFKSIFIMPVKSPAFFMELREPKAENALCLPELRARVAALAG